MKDDLGERMKEYEQVTRNTLPKRSYTIIRVDGKAFHTYTKGLERPFDVGLTEDMDATAIALCKGIQNAKFAYVQSDEISVLIADTENINTQPWFGNNIQKMCSISASIATDAFNRARLMRKLVVADGAGRFVVTEDDLINQKLALFDSRVYQIPQREEVKNYFIWRQKDCVRNSISSAAQSMYSSKELHRKSTSDMQEMMFQKDTNWNDYEDGFKRGRLIEKHEYVVEATEDRPLHRRTKWVANPAIDILKHRQQFDWKVPYQL